MADQLPNPDTGIRPTEDRPPSTPRWVKMFGIIVILLVLLFVIMHLTGGGFRGHTPSGDAGDTPFVTLVATPPVEHGVQQT